MAPAGRGSSAARTLAPARRGSSAARTLGSGLAGGESGEVSASKLFVVIIGDGTVERRIASCGGVVREPPAAETGINRSGQRPRETRKTALKRKDCRRSG